MAARAVASDEYIAALVVADADEKPAAGWDDRGNEQVSKLGKRRTIVCCRQQCCATIVRRQTGTSVSWWVHGLPMGVEGGTACYTVEQPSAAPAPAPPRLIPVMLSTEQDVTAS